jgi:hypothetical protein
MFTLPVNLSEFEADQPAVFRHIGNYRIAVELAGGNPAEYAEVYTVSGERILHKPLHNEEYFELSIPQHPSNLGLYFIVIKYSQGILTHKIVL